MFKQASSNILLTVVSPSIHEPSEMNNPICLAMTYPKPFSHTPKNYANFSRDCKISLCSTDLRRSPTHKPVLNPPVVVQRDDCPTEFCSTPSGLSVSRSVPAVHDNLRALSKKPALARCDSFESRLTDPPLLGDCGAPLGTRNSETAKHAPHDRDATHGHVLCLPPSSTSCNTSSPVSLMKSKYNPRKGDSAVRIAVSAQQSDTVVSAWPHSPSKTPNTNGSVCSLNTVDKTTPNRSLCCRAASSPEERSQRFLFPVSCASECGHFSKCTPHQSCSETTKQRESFTACDVQNFLSKKNDHGEVDPIDSPPLKVSSLPRGAFSPMRSTPCAASHSNPLLLLSSSRYPQSLGTYRCSYSSCEVYRSKKKRPRAEQSMSPLAFAACVADELPPGCYEFPKLQYSSSKGEYRVRFTLDGKRRERSFSTKIRGNAYAQAAAVSLVDLIQLRCRRRTESAALTPNTLIIDDSSKNTLDSKKKGSNAMCDSAEIDGSVDSLSQCSSNHTLRCACRRDMIDTPLDESLSPQCSCVQSHSTVTLGDDLLESVEEKTIIFQDYDVSQQKVEIYQSPKKIFKMIDAYRGEQTNASSLKVVHQLGTPAVNQHYGVHSTCSEKCIRMNVSVDRRPHNVLFNDNAEDRPRSKHNDLQQDQAPQNFPQSQSSRCALCCGTSNKNCNSSLSTSCAPQACDTSRLDSSLEREGGVSSNKNVVHSSEQSAFCCSISTLASRNTEFETSQQLVELLSQCTETVSKMIEKSNVDTDSDIVPPLESEVILDCCKELHRVLTTLERQTRKFGFDMFWSRNLAAPSQGDSRMSRNNGGEKHLKAQRLFGAKSSTSPLHEMTVLSCYNPFQRRCVPNEGIPLEEGSSATNALPEDYIQLLKEVSNTLLNSSPRKPGNRIPPVMFRSEGPSWAVAAPYYDYKNKRTSIYDCVIPLTDLSPETISETFMSCVMYLLQSYKYSKVTASYLYKNGGWSIP